MSIKHPENDYYFAKKLPAFLKEEKPPESPKEEKTRLEWFQVFLITNRSEFFLPFWSKMTGVPEPILEYLKFEYDKSMFLKDIAKKELIK